MELYKKHSVSVFPIAAPLVHCITNEISSELLANGLLFVGAKPIMAEDVREFPELFRTTDSLFLNLGKLSPAKEASLLAASQLAGYKPVVLDIVGAQASSIRQQLAQQLASQQPTVIKGNISELRAFCGLPSHSRGVDGNPFDQEATAVEELIIELQKLPTTSVYLATGKKDIIVYQQAVYLLENGVPELDCFTGTGDLVGALIAGVLGTGVEPLTATIAVVSYFNLCGEAAKAQLQPTMGLADFRQETMNQLSLLYQTGDWQARIKGGLR